MIYKDNKAYYPLIFAQEIKSTINGKEMSSGLGLSQGLSSKVGRTSSGATNGYLKASSSLQIYQTNYSFSYSVFNSYLGNIYSEILLPNLEKTNYLIASRSTEKGLSYAGFCVRKIENGCLSSDRVYESENWSANWGGTLFPIVSVPISRLKLSESGYVVF